MNRNMVFLRTLLAGFLLAFIFTQMVDAKPARKSTGKQSEKEKKDPDEADTLAKQAILIDKETGSVLFEKEADTRMAPSSMSKLMLAYCIFDRVKKGKSKLTDTFTVTERAWKMKGSRMFLNVNDVVTLDQLIHGLVVQSGNDAAVLLGDTLWGSEEKAAEKMNEKAAELGLKDSHFANVTGLPNDDHYMTARDLAKLAIRIMDDFPDFYKLFSIQEYTYNNVTQQNNLAPMLKFTPPADGLKTGFTDKGGYGVTTSVLRDGKRLVLVVNGLRTMWNREMESKQLFEWGFTKFKSYTIFEPNAVVDVADIWLGNKEATKIIVKDRVVVNVLKKKKRDMKVEIAYDAPLRAPLSADVPVGEIRLTAPGMPDKTYPLYAADNVEKLSGFNRMNAAFKYLVFGADKSSVTGREKGQVELPVIKEMKKKEKSAA